MPEDDAVEVLHGATEDGYSWTVRAWLDGPDDLMTMLRVIGDDGTHGEGGFGGLPLYGGELVNSWVGSRSGQPIFVVVRAHPDVTAVEVVSRTGTRAVSMSAPNPTFCLRFGVLQVADDDEVFEIRAVGPKGPKKRPLRMPPRRD